MPALTPKADVDRGRWNVRFGSKAAICNPGVGAPLQGGGEGQKDQVASEPGVRKKLHHNVSLTALATQSLTNFRLAGHLIFFSLASALHAAVVSFRATPTALAALAA